MSEHPERQTAAQPKPRIYTIAPSQPFLPTLARALLDGELPVSLAPRTALELSAITLMLPTRRATRALQDAFLTAGGGKALLLPRIRPIAEGEEDLTLLSGLAGLGSLGTAELDVPAAVSELERRLVLTKLVLQWSAAMRAQTDGDADAALEADLAPFAAAGADTPAQAANLARELARLIDMVETENVSLAGLETIVSPEFSAHWQQTLTFLNIVTQWWPAHLSEIGALSPMDRRNRLILAEAARLNQTKPRTPTIIAGVTGSIPATVELMRAVASLEQGAIVLPGVDLDLDELSWQAITGGSSGGGSGARPHSEHPQFGIKTLLDRLGVTRADIVALRNVDQPAHLAVRGTLMSEAMRPSSTTAKWHTFAAAADTAAYARAIEDLVLIEAPSAQDEAETIALIMRGVAQTPGQTAALVSPDRLLARRVAIRLETWGICVDDSAGRPFAKTVPGTVLDLAIEALAQDFAPAALIALLKHPLVRLRLDPFSIRTAARAIELAAFRGPYLGQGLAGVRAALDVAERDCAGDGEPHGMHRPRAVRRLFPQDWRAAHELINRLADATAPLTLLFDTAHPHPLSAFAKAHATVSEALCAEPEPEAPTSQSTIDPAAIGGETKPSALWQGEAGLAAKTLFEALLVPTLPAPEVAAKDYPDLYRALIATENVRPRVPVHPRLSIWGPFEARLQQADVVILGSLNDGTWPQSADPGPWLNRPMRQTLKLPAPEEKIGYAAHDFTQLIAGPRVYLTRAEKIDGVPTVPSRWLMRIDAVLSSMGLSQALREETGGSTYLAWARMRDAATRHAACPRPTPRPALAIRPRKLSVSAIESWIANPYAIYASRILNLEALPPIGTEPDAAIRGGIIHEALARFTAHHPETLPNDIEGVLLDHAKAVLHEWTGHPRVAAFWLPRFERFAAWFAQTEPSRRIQGSRLVAEVKGSIVIGSLDLPFTLTARADRIDVAPGHMIITDYKTGTPPSARQVQSQYSPQLPLEAAIAASGGFAGIPASAISGLRYISASGGEPAGVETFVTNGDADELAKRALEGLVRHIALFDDENTPYAATRRTHFRYDFDDFAHLARVAEWSGSSDNDEEA